MEWCFYSNLDLNINKTKEIILNFRKSKCTEQSGLCIHGEEVKSFKFLRLHISADLDWSADISQQVKKAQQRLYFLWKLEHIHLPQNLLTNFYCSAIESLLTYCCMVWFSSCMEQNRKDLQRVVIETEHVTGTSLPLQWLSSEEGQLLQKTISKDLTHPEYHLFSPLPSRRSYRAKTTKTNSL